MELISSTPTYKAFSPHYIPYQADVINDVKHKYDYGLGVHEVLLSGSVGSAKSVLMAHLVVRHCLDYRGARACLCRRSLPDLKSTIFQKVLEHLYGTLTEGKHFRVDRHSASIKFKNGSEIISRSWADRKFEKFRSLELSMALVEELTENKEDYFYKELKLRLGRLPHVSENLIICATNPDSPAHWAYKYFELELDEGFETPSNERTPTKHVYYSKTKDNIFLPESYIRQIETDYDEKMYQRMGLGRWIEIGQETIYYPYNKKIHYKKEKYKIQSYYPIHICFDFNIAKGKPMSSCAFQFIKNKFHVFDECIVEGADTEEIMEEWAGKGIFKHDAFYYVHGDATGDARSTKSKKSDYDIIKKYLANYRFAGDDIDFKMAVPKANPPVRKRHNIVNAYLKNKAGKIRFANYGCKTVDEGLRLTALKDNAQYIEDDSKHYQHVTTALGYGMVWCHNNANTTSGFRSEQIR